MTRLAAQFAPAGCPWRICRAAMLLLCAAGCTQGMYDQPRYEPLEASEFFDDGQSARRPVEGTVARGQLWHNDVFFTGRNEQGELATEFPPDPRTAAEFHLDAATLARGRQRYDIFCAACHDRAGGGGGMVVQRGFTRPPALYADRVRNQPVGYYFEVISRGFRDMPAYAASIPAADRWAIVAYVRALQASQRLSLDDAPPSIQQQFTPDP